MRSFLGFVLAVVVIAAVRVAIKRAFRGDLPPDDSDKTEQVEPHVVDPAGDDKAPERDPIAPPLPSTEPPEEEEAKVKEIDSEVLVETAQLPTITFRVKDAGVWKTDRDARRVYAIDRSTKRIVAFDGRTGDRIWDHGLDEGAKPGNLLVLDSTLVASRHGSNATQLVGLDRETREVRFEVKLPEFAARVPVLQSPPGSRFFYTIVHSDDFNPKQRMFQIDAKTGEVRREIPLKDKISTRLKFSRDGLWAIAHRKYRNTAVRLYEVDEELGSFELRRELRNQAYVMFVRPFGRRWALSDQVFESDLTGTQRNCIGLSATLHPSRDLVASIGGRKPRGRKSPLLAAVFERPSTKTPLSAFELPEPIQPPDEPGWTIDTVYPQPNLEFTQSGERLFFSLDNGACVIDLRDLPERVPERLVVKAPTRVSTHVSQAVTVPLRVERQDGEARDDIGYEIVVDGVGESARTAPRVVGSELHWTPTSQDAGVRPFVLRAKSADGLETEFRIVFDVNEVRMVVDFDIGGLAVDPESGLAIASPRTFRSDTTSHELAVLDLRKGEVLVQGRFARGIQTAHVTPAGVLVTSTGGRVIFVLSKQTLTEERRLHVDAPVEGFVSLPGSRVAALIGDRWVVYDSRTLEPVDNYLGLGSRMPRDLRFTLVHRYPQVPLPVAPGPSGKTGFVLAGNSIIDVESNETVFLSGQLDLPPFKPVPERLIDVHTLRARGGDRCVPWGRWSSWTALHAEEKRVKITRQGPGLVLSARPLFVSAGNLPVVTPGQFVSAIEYRELVEGVVASTQPLHRLISPEIAIDLGDRLLLASGRTIYLAEIPNLFVETPVSLVPYQSVIDCTIEEPVKLQLRAQGGSGKYHFEVVNRSSKFKLHASSGEIQIDVPRIWEEDCIGAFRLRERGPRLTVLRMQELEKSLDRNPIEYEALTGRPLPLGQLAMSLTIWIRVRDADAAPSKDAFEGLYCVSLIVRVPRQEVLDTLKREEPETIDAEELQRSVRTLERTLDRTMRRLELIEEEL